MATDERGQLFLGMHKKAFSVVTIESLGCDRHRRLDMASRRKEKSG
jgi:hypothetical protein